MWNRLVETTYQPSPNLPCWFLIVSWFQIRSVSAYCPMMPPILNPHQTIYFSRCTGICKSSYSNQTFILYLDLKLDLLDDSLLQEQTSAYSPNEALNQLLSKTSFEHFDVDLRNLYDVTFVCPFFVSIYERFVKFRFCPVRFGMDWLTYGFMDIHISMAVSVLMECTCGDCQIQPNHVFSCLGQRRM